MKKILIIATSFVLCSSVNKTTNISKSTYNLKTCVDTIEDVQSWIMEDALNNQCNPELAETYYVNLEKVRIKLLKEIKTAEKDGTIVYQNK